MCIPNQREKMSKPANNYNDLEEPMLTINDEPDDDSPYDYGHDWAGDPDDDEPDDEVPYDGPTPDDEYDDEPDDGSEKIEN